MLPLPLSCDAFAHKCTHTHARTDTHTNTRVECAHSEARRVDACHNPHTNVNQRILLKTPNWNLKQRIPTPNTACNSVADSQKLTKVLHLQHLNEIKHISCSCNGRKRQTARQTARQSDIGRELICWMCQWRAWERSKRKGRRCIKGNEFVRWKFCAWSLS